MFRLGAIPLFIFASSDDVCETSCIHHHSQYALVLKEKLKTYFLMPGLETKTVVDQIAFPRQD